MVAAKTFGRRQAACGGGDSTCKESIERVSGDRRTWRGQNPFVCGTSACGGGAFGVSRRAAAHFLWRGEQELCRRISRRAGSHGVGVAGRIRREAEGLSPAETTWTRNLQENKAQMRTMPGEQDVRLLSRIARDKADLNAGERDAGIWSGQTRGYFTSQVSPARRSFVRSPGPRLAMTSLICSFMTSS